MISLIDKRVLDNLKFSIDFIWQIRMDIYVRSQFSLQIEQITGATT